MAEHKSDSIKHIIKENMAAILKEMGYSNPDLADKRSKGLAFLKFYLREIFIQFNDIDEEDLETGIVDKANDLGIDFIYTQEDKIYLIQSKYGESYDGDSNLNYFVNLPDNIRKQEYISRAHVELKNILNDLIKINKPVYYLFFITDQRIDRKTINIYENYRTDSNISILSLTELRQEYERVESMDDLPPTEVVFNIGDEDCILLKTLSKGVPTILITQKGSKVKELYQRYKESLFNYNIRFWLGMKNPVNSNMKDTIKKEPDYFFYYNNGVTAVCDSFQPIENKIVCKNLQIINGAQTITTIAKQPDDLELSKVKILVKVIEGNKEKSTLSSQSLNEKIVKNNNNQTVIVPSDFHSNDYVQLSIENKCKDIKYTAESPYKSIFYKRKRRKELPKNTKVLSMQDLGKAYYSFFYNPYDLNSSISRLWDTGKNGLYYTVFGENGESITTITNYQFEKMLAAEYIFEYVKKKLKGLNKETSPVILFKYHILWGIKQLLDKKYNEKELSTIYSLVVSSGKYVNENISQSDEGKFRQIFDRVVKHIELCINNEKNKEFFVIRNLQRSIPFTTDIKKSMSLVLVSDIPDLL